MEQFGGLGVVRVQATDLTPALADLLAGLPQHLLVGRVLPLGQVLDPLEQATARESSGPSLGRLATCPGAGTATGPRGR